MPGSPWAAAVAIEFPRSPLDLLPSETPSPKVNSKSTPTFSPINPRYGRLRGGRGPDPVPFPGSLGLPGQVGQNYAIFQGTSEIQRLIISRAISRDALDVAVRQKLVPVADTRCGGLREGWSPASDQEPSCFTSLPGGADDARFVCGAVYRRALTDTGSTGGETRCGRIKSHSRAATATRHPKASPPVLANRSALERLFAGCTA